MTQSKGNDLKKNRWLVWEYRGLNRINTTLLHALTTPARMIPHWSGMGTLSGPPMSSPVSLVRCVLYPCTKSFSVYFEFTIPWTYRYKSCSLISHTSFNVPYHNLVNRKSYPGHMIEKDTRPCPLRYQHIRCHCGLEPGRHMLCSLTWSQARTTCYTTTRATIVPSAPRLALKNSNVSVRNSSLFRKSVKKSPQ